MISIGQTLHIKYTGERLKLLRIVTPNKKNGLSKTMYFFEGKNFGINEDQIRVAIKFKRWEII